MSYSPHISACARNRAAAGSLSPAEPAPAARGGSSSCRSRPTGGKGVTPVTVQRELRNTSRMAGARATRSRSGPGIAANTFAAADSGFRLHRARRSGWRLPSASPRRACSCTPHLHPRIRFNQKRSSPMPVSSGSSSSASAPTSPPPTPPYQPPPCRPRPEQCCPPAQTGNPVRYWNGAVVLPQQDLEVPGGGLFAYAALREPDQLRLRRTVRLQLVPQPARPTPSPAAARSRSSSTPTTPTGSTSPAAPTPPATAWWTWPWPRTRPPAR